VNKNFLNGFEKAAFSTGELLTTIAASTLSGAITGGEKDGTKRHIGALRGLTTSAGVAAPLLAHALIGTEASGKSIAAAMVLGGLSSYLATRKFGPKYSYEKD